MTLLVWFIVTPAKSGSVTGVEIHLAGEWPNDGNNNDSLILEVFIWSCTMAVTYSVVLIANRWLKCEPLTSSLVLLLLPT